MYSEALAVTVLHAVHDVPFAPGVFLVDGMIQEQMQKQTGLGIPIF